jgi:hypothetical protein
MNAAKCLVCGDVLVSKFRHDFRLCRCGNLHVDGGDDYLKRGAIDPSLILEIRTEEEYQAALESKLPIDNH